MRKAENVMYLWFPWDFSGLRNLSFISPKFEEIFIIRIVHCTHPERVSELRKGYAFSNEAFLITKRFMNLSKNIANILTKKVYDTFSLEN